MTDDLVRVTFFVFAPPYLEHCADECGVTYEEALAERYASRWGGVDVTAEPTEVHGEFRITGLFPRAFAEARSYST